MATHPLVREQVQSFLKMPGTGTSGTSVHSEEGAKAAGFPGALVLGVLVYGWATPAIIRALGDQWLHDGWATVRFRRPVHPNRELSVIVEQHGDAWDLNIVDEQYGPCIVGQVGLGKASWYSDLTLPTTFDVTERPAPLPQFRVDSRPAPHDLRAMMTHVGSDEARRWSSDLIHAQDPRFVGSGSVLLHPSWLVGQMNPLAHLSYNYGPYAVQISSQVQHLGPARADQEITVGGRLRGVFERSGHHYYETDNVVLDGDRKPIAAVRHATIFQLR